MNNLLNEIKGCKICKDQLVLGPRPVLNAHEKSKVLIIGQASSTKVHKSGIPWDDQSGKRLRIWLVVDDIDFYDPTKFGIVPMGFCYPGKANQVIYHHLKNAPHNGIASCLKKCKALNSCCSLDDMPRCII
tara:strand:- start:930 stop:1322 length:393 start_codon:yes stop_codon:yes gene_type:complete